MIAVKDMYGERTIMEIEPWFILKPEGQEEKSVKIASRSNQKDEKITEDIFREAKKNGTF